MTDAFKWRHYEPKIILTCISWYLRYSLSYRNLEEMMTECGLSVDHSTIFRWAQRYAPELYERCRPHLKQTNNSWRLDETCVTVRGKWMYLYRAVDSTGQTCEFLANETRNTRAAKRIFRQVLGRSNVTAPRVINVDKNPFYIDAERNLERKGTLPDHCKRRQSAGIPRQMSWERPAQERVTSMSDRIPESHLDLIEGPIVATLAT